MTHNNEVRVVVKGKNIDVTPSLKDYSLKRVGKVSRYFQGGENVRIDVVLSVQRDRHIAEITCHLGGLIMRGESRTGDLYVSIDEATDRIERQVRKYKTRINRKAPVSLRFGDGLPENESWREDEEEPRIVRNKRFPVKPMDVDEAILQMELLGHDFFVFTNADTEGVNVIYKRKDGQYGLMEPIVG